MRNRVITFLRELEVYLTESPSSNKAGAPLWTEAAPRPLPKSEGGMAGAVGVAIPSLLSNLVVIVIALPGFLRHLYDILIS